MGARFFMIGGGASIGKLLDQAAAHGAPGRAVAHGTPRRRRPDVYGAVELHGPKKMCGGRHDWVSRPEAIVCIRCDEQLPGIGPRVPVKRVVAKEAP